MRSLRLQRLNHDHLDQLVAIDQVALGGLWSVDTYRRELDSPSSDLLGAIDPQGGLLGFGCAWAIVDECHITGIALRPEYQRQGLGSALLWGLLYLARQRGMKRATLEVRPSNRAALSLYEKFGFQEAGRRKRYYADGEDAAILWLGKLDWPQVAPQLDRTSDDLRDRLAQHQWMWDGRVVAPSVGVGSPPSHALE
jgi:ribosomal-protein-alanine N-acetyltransferase